MTELEWERTWVKSTVIDWEHRLFIQYADELTAALWEMLQSTTTAWGRDVFACLNTPAKVRKVAVKILSEAAYHLRHGKYLREFVLNVAQETEGVVIEELCRELQKARFTSCNKLVGKAKVKAVKDMERLVKQSVEWKDWTWADLKKVGSRLVQVLLESCDIISVHKFYTEQSGLSITEEGRAWIEKGKDWRSHEYSGLPWMIEAPNNAPIYYKMSIINRAKRVLPNRQVNYKFYELLDELSQVQWKIN